MELLFRAFEINCVFSVIYFNIRSHSSDVTVKVIYLPFLLLKLINPLNKQER